MRLWSVLIFAWLKKETRDAILQAGEAILEGKYHDQFLVDP